MLAWILSPGRTDSVVVALVRIAVGLSFLPAGAGKFLNHDAYVRRFERWDLPAPDLFPYVIGTVEVVCGLLLVTGLLVRPAALALAGTMVGAVTTAGRIDGGFDLVVPPLLFVLLLWVAIDGGGRWRPAARLGLPAGRSSSAGRAPLL